MHGQLVALQKFPFIIILILISVFSGTKVGLHVLFDLTKKRKKKRKEKRRQSQPSDVFSCFSKCRHLSGHPPSSSLKSFLVFIRLHKIKNHTSFYLNNTFWAIFFLLEINLNDSNTWGLGLVSLSQSWGWGDRKRHFIPPSSYGNANYSAKFQHGQEVNRIKSLNAQCVRYHLCSDDIRVSSSVIGVCTLSTLS